MTSTSALSYHASRVAKHIEWARTQGIRRLIEEDELDPIARAVSAGRRLAWRTRNGVPRGAASPVFVVGAQRSGTNLVMRALARSPEVEAHNENDRVAFHRFMLRSDQTVADIVTASRHRIVAFKPLCDSGRIATLLDQLPYDATGRAIWVYRNVDDRARSAVAKFGDSNLQALRRIAGGEGQALWHAQGMSADTLRLLRGIDFVALSPESASALFWYVRNVLFFEQQLDERADVRLVSYDRLVDDPPGVMAAMFSWLGLSWRGRYVEDVGHRSPTAAARPKLSIDPVVRTLCTALGERLDGCEVTGSRSGGAAAS